MRLVYPAPAYLDPYMNQPMKVDLELLNEQQAETELRNGIVGLIGNITAYALVIPLFIFHWRLANKKTAKTRSRK
jgi:phosphoglycerol transferase MdoB-like AlkP superfamily enzyme